MYFRHIQDDFGASFALATRRIKRSDFDGRPTTTRQRFKTTTDGWDKRANCASQRERYGNGTTTYNPKPNNRTLRLRSLLALKGSARE